MLLFLFIVVAAICSLFSWINAMKLFCLYHELTEIAPCFQLRIPQPLPEELLLSKSPLRNQRICACTGQLPAPTTLLYLLPIVRGFCSAVPECLGCFATFLGMCRVHKGSYFESPGNMLAFSTTLSPKYVLFLCSFC